MFTRTYALVRMFIRLSVILVATSAVAASNETGGPEPDQIYQTAFKEFKAAESDCQQAPTAQALTRLSKAAQALADATTRLLDDFLKKSAIPPPGRFRRDYTLSSFAPPLGCVFHLSPFTFHLSPCLTLA